jgi:hypothetical protein
MKKIIEWVKDNPNRSMFLLPIILVAGISISHVVSWYDIANPMSWAIYLSIAIEVGAMTALVAATNKIKGGVWFMFGLITLIQMIGNIFYSFKEIDENGELFKSWVELTGPFWDLFSDSTDISSMKRWLAFLEGGLLPIISLTSLHFFVKYEKSESKIEESPNEGTIDTKKIWEKVNELKEEGKLDTPTEEDIENEPTALAFTPYEVEDITEGLLDLQEKYNTEPLKNDDPIEPIIFEVEKDEQPNLVEEEIPEDEIILPITGDTTSETQIEIVANKTLGDELTRTWNKIIKKNNNIQRLG